jgi:prephenate dehydrogenase
MIGVVGAGLIGTSVALAARRADAEVRIVTIDRDDPIEAVHGADLVVLATPVDVIIELLRTHAIRFAGSVITDVGSTKRAIVGAARDAGVSDFVGGHPMAGAATTGPSGARADLFDGRSWFLVPGMAAADAVARVQSFVERLGAHPAVFDDDGGEHDRLMAAVSHLPQLAATALMKVVGDAVGDEGLSWAGSGCRDTTRLAASAASMWESLLATNADALAPLVKALAAELDQIGDALDDRDATRRLFGAANAYRRRLEQS